MKAGSLKLAAAWLGGCVVISTGLTFLPQTQATAPTTKPLGAYGGVEHQIRRTGAQPEHVIFVLTGSARPAQAAPQTTTPLLVGIVGRSVYLKSTASGEAVSVPIGESLDGWKVVAVRGRTVTLEGPNGHLELSLFNRSPTVAESSGEPAMTSAGRSTLPSEQH